MGDARHYDENQPVRLEGRREEFRVALKEEIVAAQRQAVSSAVSLSNGRRCANVGSAFQYVFEIDSLLNLPGDAPGDLHVPHRKPLEVTVISVEGSVITLSVQVDLGDFVPSARFQSNLAHLMRRLIERIEGLADKPNPTGDRVIGQRPVSGESVSVSNLELYSDKQTPNENQVKAIASSLGRDTTFVWGPPGTGKSRTIGSIGEQLFLRCRSLLLVSHTNSAVDHALWHIAKSVGLSELEEGKVIRVGDTKDSRILDCPDLLASTHVERRSAELVHRRNEVEVELRLITKRVKDLTSKIDVAEWVQLAPADIEEMEGELNILAESEVKLQGIRAELEQLAKQSPYWAKAARRADVAERKSREAQALDVEILRKRDRYAEVEAVNKTASNLFNEANSIYSETSSVGWLVRQWRRLPSPDEQRKVVEARRIGLESCTAAVERASRSLSATENAQWELLQEVASFQKKYGAPAVDILAQATRHKEVSARVRSEERENWESCTNRRTLLQKRIAENLRILRAGGLSDAVTASPEDMLKAIKEAYERAKKYVADSDIEELDRERSKLNSELQGLEEELCHINDTLACVEESVIAEATVVATTLTRAYLRDAIQARRFDTVILDEASMAPIPALWVAASLADKNAVVVGDPEQLPPIVLSENELAKKWLGRGVFDEAGLGTEANQSVPYLIQLTTQYRMHPEVSAIPNALFYGGRLENDPSTLDESSLDNWYNREWGHDYPVLLVDTGIVDAWVTSVAQGSRSSRLNFLSATICMDIARQLLRDDRPPASQEQEKRILIGCPYKPHNKLLDLLIRDEGLQDEIKAGTAHAFQGAESDVVIFDLVNDKPHWRVGMFMQKNDVNTKRLLNVALTRARHRLIVVGDFEYVSKNAKKAFLGTHLVPFLTKNYACVSALDVVPCGLSARAAKAQSNVFGGDLVPKEDRIVVTQEEFYGYLRRDISRSERRIVIYSPFMTSNRIGQLEAALRGALDRGIGIFVITKPHSERSSGVSEYRAIENSLLNWGIVVVHKKGMHEKLVFCDNNVLWSGSLNPLSFRDTQEIMERRFSAAVVSEFAQKLRLDELVGEYKNGPPSCPYCESTVIASEGRNEPYYWKCIEKNCFTRSIDEPPILDGIIVCSNCGGKVRIGEWGDEVMWRCNENNRHRQKIARTHLRLPKMRAIIPKKMLRKLDKQFGIELPSNRDESQGSLF